MNDLEPSPRRRAQPAPTSSPGDEPKPPPSVRGVAEQPSTTDPFTFLLANVIGKDPAAAGAILDRLGGLARMAHASEAELVRASISRKRARLVRAAFELARMSIGRRPTIGQRLSCGGDVWLHMRARLAGVPVEEFWMIALDVRHRVLADEICARGSLTAVEVHPRDVFRRLISLGAAAVIFCHNHPSGDPTPSRQDVELTDRLRDVGQLCGIPVLDHVVVATTGHISLADRGWR